MFEQDVELISAQVRAGLAALGVPGGDQIEVKWTATPFAGQWGLGTNACFQAAAAEARSGKKVNVPQRAQELARLVAERVALPDGFASVSADKAYVNVYFDTSAYAGRVVSAAIEGGADFGRGPDRAERVMVEYAQPNTHHSFHIGHARNAILGESLARLFEFSGYTTLRAAYPGDIGLGVITVLWAYARFYQGQEPAGLHERGQWLLKIYAEATALLTEKAGESAEDKTRREAYDAERRDLYKRWDAGDPEVRALWERTRTWSLDELNAILADLDIHIDFWFYESEEDEPSKAVVDELIARGIAEDQRPEGPVIVKIDEKLGLTKDKFGVAVVLRSDGTTLYLTKDLSLAQKKFTEHHVDQSIYVVDFRQSLHFQQAFKILELMGYKQAEKCYHLSYGFVTLPEGAMSARRGTVVLYQDVADEAVRRVQATIAEKNPDLAQVDRDRVAREIGLGALCYALLSVDNVKGITFEWDAALSLDGKSAPYIQNAYVRANSILKKAGEMPASAHFSDSLHPLEVGLIELIAQFPKTVQQAAEDHKPLLMATYAYDLGKAFHSFYHEVPVNQAEPELKAARMRLTAAVRQTLANALKLLVVKAPDVM